MMVAWAEDRPLVTLRAELRHGRVRKMFDALKDGQPCTRRDLHERGGFYLTNNAAAELRVELEPQGYGVAQWTAKQAGEIVHVYQIVLLSKSPQSRGILSHGNRSQSTHGSPHAGRGDSESKFASQGSPSVTGVDGTGSADLAVSPPADPVQLSIGDAA